jgi:crotonobetainyl-CoA:carnitine CoA-transferase CaiB-like acyl-CoA transferase
VPGRVRSWRVPRTPAPLSGLRVIDASRVLAGPYLAMLLADLGADVVKIEKPGGGDQTRAWGPPWIGGNPRTSAYFASANRGKRSLVLDLKRDQGRSVFGRMVASADVLVENFLPAEWRQLGFRRRDWTRAYPRLVQCTISGYGPGADADRPAYDVVLQAESGLMALTGYPEPSPPRRRAGARGREPVRVGIAIVDILTALFASSALLAALHKRQRGGHGARVEIAMADAAAAFLSYAAQSFLADGREPQRLGSRHPNLAPYQALPTQDGWIVVGVGGDPAWRRLCAAMERQALAADSRFATNALRLENRAALDRTLSATFRRQPTATWQVVLRRHRVPSGPLHDVGTAVARARDRQQLQRLRPGAFGALETIAAPWRFGTLRQSSRRGPPALGEHTREILAAYGFAPSEIQDLLAAGVVQVAR